MSNWRDEAACLDHDTNLWFPDDLLDQDPDGPQKRETPRLYRQAKRICLSCPVREECLEYALDFPEPYGMWGGTTRPERLNILRARRKDARDLEEST